jgi:hypothetical protein
MNEFQMLFKFIIDGFVSPGSFAMWAILFVGFGILGMVAERVWYLYFKCGTGSGTFMASISKYLKAGDYEKAISIPHLLLLLWPRALQRFFRIVGKAPRQFRNQ